MSDALMDALTDPNLNPEMGRKLTYTWEQIESPHRDDADKAFMKTVQNALLREYKRGTR